MKKILYSALAVSMLAACSQDELVGMQDPNAIAFAGAYIDNATRGNDPSVTATNINTFDVWGYVNNSAGHLFDGVAVNKLHVFSKDGKETVAEGNTLTGTLDTVEIATPASFATSLIVTINPPRFLLRFRFSIPLPMYRSEYFLLQQFPYRP